MTWLAPKLRHKVQIRQGVDTPNADTGGNTRTYNHLVTIWAGFEPLTFRTAAAGYIREQQIEGVATHKFTVRKNTTLGVDFMGGLPLIRSDYFLFVNVDGYRGRLFQMLNVSNHKERGEYLTIIAKEMEEQEGGAYAS